MIDKYEAIFILEERKSEDGGKAFIEDLQSIVKELGGEIIETDEMGLKQFAHPIHKKSAGYYWGVVLNLPRNMVLELKQKFQLDSTVLRLEIFSYDRPEKTLVDA